MDYWGAQAYYTSGGPNGAGLFYNPPPQNESVDFTQPPNTADTTIEEIYTQISNAKPAHLSALADQWQNVYNLLTEIWAQLYNESSTLYNEHWKSSDARDVFMKWGPGQTLAYLDEWMTAALANQSGLRALSGIVHDFQGQMETLWQEYRQAVQDAQNRNGWQKFSDFMNHYNVFGGSDQKDLHAQEDQERLKATQKAQEEYNQKARAKAWSMSQQVFSVFSTFSGGHGPVFMPPNAVMDPPGHPNFNLPGGGTPGAPGGAPGAPSIAPPNVALSMAGPPAASAADHQQQLQNFLEQLNGPPNAPGAPAPSVAGPPMPFGTPMMATSALAANLAKGPAGANLTAPTGAAKAFDTTSLTRTSGVLGRGSAPVAPSEPATSALRSPALPPSGARVPQPRRPAGSPATESEAAPGRGQRATRGVVGKPRGPVEATQTGVEEPFARTPSSTAPPVLNNKRSKGAPARPEQPAEPGRATTAGRPATPPVLNRPGAAGPEPAPPAKRRGGKPGRAKSSGRTQGVETEWVGVEAARATAGSPVLDAPDLPAVAVPNLDEVPPVLRRSMASATAPGRPAAVPPELSARRRNQRTDERAAEPAEQQIVTDEQAFAVETPGGEVLGGRKEDTTYREEPRAVLGGN